MNVRIVLWVATMLLGQFAKGQVKAEEIAKIKKKYPKAGYVLQNSMRNFAFVQTDSEPYITETREESFLALKPRVRFQYGMFYDESSSIKKFSAGKKSNIKDEAYSSRSIFHSDMRVQWTNLFLENKGDKQRVKIEKEYSDVKYFTKVSLINSYATLSQTIQFEIPFGYTVDLVERNFEGFTVDKTEIASVDKTIIQYTVSDMPEKWSESGQAGASYIFPHILVMVKGYTNLKGEKKQVLSSTEDLYAWYKGLVKSMNNDNKPLQAKVEELIKNATTDTEKVERIFYWVQDNIRYIAFEDGIAGFKPEECQKVYEKRYGDCKGMANLMKQMLLIAGYDARLAWLGTRTVAYSYDYPSLAADNHMICVLYLEGKPIYLDGTEKFIAYGEVAERIQGRSIMVEEGETFKILTTPIKTDDQNLKEIKMNLSLNDAFDLIGDVRFSLYGERKSDFLYFEQKFDGKDKEEMFPAYIRGGNSFFKVTNESITGKKQGGKPTIVKGDVVISERANEFDGELYLNLDPYLLMSNQKFKKDRKGDYWFSFKKLDKLQINLSLSDGFEVISFPDPLKIENEDFQLEVGYTQNEGQLQYSFQVRIPTAEIKLENIEEWNKAIDLLDAFYEQPVLIKINK